VLNNSTPARLVAAVALCLTGLGFAAASASPAGAAGSNSLTVTAHEYSCVVDVTTSDSAITLPGGALPARRWARITTTASSPRDFELFRYATADATFEAASTYFKEFFSSDTSPPGPAPAVIVGNISSIPQGAVVYYRLSFDLGRYVVVSDTATDQDGSAQVHQDFSVP